MKLSELAKHLSTLANALTTIGVNAPASALIELSEGLAPFKSHIVANLEKVDFTPSRDFDAGTKVGDAARVISAFDAFLKFSAKPATLNAINLLVSILGQRPNMSVQSFIDSVYDAFEPDLVRSRAGESIHDAYVAALEDAKHDADRFPALFSKLAGDKRLNKDDIVEIASRFAFPMSKSTTKQLALERINKLHSASESFAAKSRAMKGKSAA